MIFQALGSNYTFGYALKHLFTVGRRTDSKKLVSELETIYGGKAFLYSKGRNALASGLSVIDLRGGGVAINGITCSVVPEAVDSNNQKKYFIDINPETGNFTSAQLKEIIKENPQIKAVIIQNTYGNMQDISEIKELAEVNQLTVIEDLAHSIGQQYPSGELAGTVGDLVMLSFGRDKIIDAVNGGALIVRNEELLKSISPPTQLPSQPQQLRDRIYPLITVSARSLYRLGLGKAILYLAYRLKLAVRSADGGINRWERLPHWQAKLITRQLQNLQAKISHRHKIMQVYRQELNDRLLTPGGTIRGAIVVKNRPRLFEILAKNGYLLADTWYDAPVGPARKYQSDQYPEKANLASLALSQQIINLPTHQLMTANKATTLARLILKEDQ